LFDNLFENVKIRCNEVLNYRTSV